MCGCILQWLQFMDDFSGQTHVDWIAVIQSGFSLSSGHYLKAASICIIFVCHLLYSHEAKSGTSVTGNEGDRMGMSK